MTVEVVKQAAIGAGVQVVVLFMKAKEWGLVKEPFDVGVEIRDFFSFRQGEDSGYRVPGGVMTLAQQVLGSPSPETFFIKKKEDLQQ